MSDSQINPGHQPIPSDVRVSTDGTTIEGDGSGGNPLRAVGGSASPTFTSVNVIDVLRLSTQIIVNLVGVHNDVNFWGSGPRTSRVEVDIVGSPVTTITGILAGQDGDLLYLTNGGGGGGNSPDQLMINDNDPASSPLNRIFTPTGKDMLLANNEGVLLIYAGGFAWQVFGNPGTISRVQQFSLEPVVIPTPLANGSTNNDYDPWVGVTVNSYVRLDTGLASTVTGLKAPGPANSEGRCVVIANISTTGTITFNNGDVGSLPGNRLLLPHPTIAVGPQGTIEFIYDDTFNTWRVKSLAI
jgi:hypothetical protein